LTVESEQKRKMTCEDTGRKGRLKVARERGPEFCREIGRKGGEKVAEERGTEFFREIGRKDGENRGTKPIGTNYGSGGQQRSEGQ
jgi:general stress protein YciG